MGPALPCAAHSMGFHSFMHLSFQLLCLSRGPLSVSLSIAGTQICVIRLKFMPSIISRPLSICGPLPNRLSVGRCPSIEFFRHCLLPLFIVCLWAVAPPSMFRCGHFLAVWAVTQDAVYLVPVRSYPSSSLSLGRRPGSCLSVGRWTRS